MPDSIEENIARIIGQQVADQLDRSDRGRHKAKRPEVSRSAEPIGYSQSSYPMRPGSVSVKGRLSLRDEPLVSYRRADLGARQGSCHDRGLAVTGSQSARVAAPFAFIGLRRARVAGIQVGRAAPIHAALGAVVAPTAADGDSHEQAYHQASNNSHDFPGARHAPGVRTRVLPSGGCEA